MLATSGNHVVSVIEGINTHRYWKLNLGLPIVHYKEAICGVQIPMQSPCTIHKKICFIGKLMNSFHYSVA